MAPIPSTVITLYADLVQKVAATDRLPASISRRQGRGGPHLYAIEKHGGSRIQRYIGPEHDPDVREEATELKLESEQAALRRQQVTMLRRAGLPAPRSRSDVFSKRLRAPACSRPDWSLWEPWHLAFFPR